MHPKYFSFQKINGLLFVIDNQEYVAGGGCVHSSLKVEIAAGEKGNWWGVEFFSVHLQFPFDIEVKTSCERGVPL